MICQYCVLKGRSKYLQTLLMYLLLQNRIFCVFLVKIGDFSIYWNAYVCMHLCKKWVHKSFVSSKSVLLNYLVCTRWLPYGSAAFKITLPHFRSMLCRPSTRAGCIFRGQHDLATAYMLIVDDMMKSRFYKHYHKPQKWLQSRGRPADLSLLWRFLGFYHMEVYYLYLNTEMIINWIGKFLIWNNFSVELYFNATVIVF